MGAVNIFLGGTGKYVAEDIQDNLDFYQLKISAPVAFDLNASSSHSGLRLRGLVTADENTNNTVPELAREWHALQPGALVGPGSSDSPGPRMNPESAILREIGTGIAANPKPTAGLYALRAHGLAVFSLLFDQSKSTAGSGAGHRLRAEIAARLESETVDGRWPRINLVTSTAGGTGAGMVIPLALWLKQRYPGCPLNLLAVTPTAFRDVLQGTPSLDELAAKGRSGTYAILRELSFLHTTDAQTAFSKRQLPVTVEGLEYRPGQQLFDRVYWFGGRELQTSRDAFEEAGLLLRVLSWDDSADDLRAEVGELPLQPVGALTAVEYPKLRLQRKIVFSVLLDAYRRLRVKPMAHAGASEAADSVHLLDYVEQDSGRVLGSWFRAGITGPLAPGSKATSVSIDATESLAQAVGEVADVGGWESIPTGVNLRPGVYDAPQSEWLPYTTKIFTDLGDQAASNQRRITQTVHNLREQEEAAFAGWLQDSVVSRRLSGVTGGIAGPNSTQEVLEILERLEREAEELEERFESPSLFPVQTPSEVESEIRSQQGMLENPGTRSVVPTVVDRVVGLLVGITVGLLSGAAFAQVQSFTLAGFSSELLAYGASVVAAALGYRAVLWFRLRDRQHSALLSVRRRGAEQRLFDLMKQQDDSRCVHWLQAELRRGQGRLSLFGEFREQVRSARAAVSDLDKLYEALLKKAESESEALTRRPAHVREEVGDCLEHDPSLSREVVPELLRRIQVEASFGARHRAAALRLKLIHVEQYDGDHFSAAAGDTRDMLTAAQGDEEAGSEHREDQLQRVENAAWRVVNWKLGENLPVDFESALLKCADGDPARATSTLAAKLASTARSLPRVPSVALPGITQAPRLRRLYAGSQAIIAEMNRALSDPGLSQAERKILSTYHANYRVVPSLGEQLVFLDLWAQADGETWAPHVISRAPEALAAERTYYGADPSVPADCTALEACFTVLPEMLAATKLERGGNVAPLAPVVCARLLGSDLETEGPTYIELFYMLRARDQIVVEREGDGPDAREVTYVRGEAGRFALVSKMPGAVSDGGFGPSRAAIVDLDAFIDFMRFDGTPIVQGQPTSVSRDPRVHVPVEAWAHEPGAVARLQREVVAAWYVGDLESDRTEWRAVAQADVEAMPLSGHRADWKRVTDRLLGGEERTTIRARLLTR